MTSHQSLPAANYPTFNQVMAFLMSIVITLLVLNISPANAGNLKSESPFLVATNASKAMTAQLLIDREKVLQDATHIETLVDRLLLPSVDVEYMAKRVLAKNWRKTSQTQKIQFKQAFKRKVIRTYAGAFKAFDGQKISYKKAKYNKTKSKASVTSQIHRSGGTPITVTYKLYKSKKAHRWLGYDVVIEGISIVKSFRDQFNQQISSQGLAKAIAALNKEFPSLTPTVTIAAHTEEPYISKNKPGQGLAIDLITQALKRAGYQVNIEFMPWKRVKNGFADGSIDITPVEFFLDPEQTPYTSSDAYITSELVIVKRKEDKLNFSNNDEFKSYIKGKGYRLGVFSELDDPIFDSFKPLVSLSFHDYCSEITRNVAQKEIDIALLDRRVANNNLTLTPNIADHLTIIPTTIIAREIKIAINSQREDHDEIRQKFNKALIAMQQDGSYNAIIKRHDTLPVAIH